MMKKSITKIKDECMKNSIILGILALVGGVLIGVFVVNGGANTMPTVNDYAPVPETAYGVEIPQDKGYLVEDWRWALLGNGGCVPSHVSHNGAGSNCGRCATINGR